MKQFLRIFSLYLFALSCLPCSDGEHGHAVISGGGKTVVLSASHNCPTHEHCNDLCSPFCTCACCGCITLNEKIAPLQLKQPAPEARHFEFFYQSRFSAGHLSALFRPPIDFLG
ncbi:MAG: DUF6660 family protein [Bacteroidota bacterium]